MDYRLGNTALVRSVKIPLKRFCNAACKEWLTSHPGKVMTIYNVADNFGNAFLRAIVPANITPGFKVSRVYPLDRNIFHDDELLFSYIMNCPLKQSQETADMGISTDFVLEENLHLDQITSFFLYRDQERPVVISRIIMRETNG